MLKRLWISLVCGAILVAGPTWARERSDIPTELTWDLSQLYPTQQAWEAERVRLTTAIPKLAESKGHLGESAQSLWKAYQTQLEVHKALNRLAAYAMMLYDQDTRVSEHQAMVASVQQLQVSYDATTAFFRPEVLAIGPETFAKFADQEPGLKTYGQVFENIFRSRPHTLNAEGETIVAQAGNLKDAGYNIRGVFCNAELPYPEVKLKDGKQVRLDASGYTHYRAVPERADRVAVFQAFFGRYNEFRRTLGTTLYSQVKAHVFDRDVRHYDSCLQAALFPENIPTEVYKQLLSDVHANLPTLHRYLKLRKRMMKLPELGYEDLYAPLVGGVETTYTPQQAMDLTLASVAPLGPDYQQGLKAAYQSRWVDFLPSTGKRSGAYSVGDAYDVHPYQLLNFNGAYEDVSTLGHESGHSMHSYLANKTQPYGLHSYSIFVAEVASTLNENLLLHYMLDHTDDPKLKLALLGNYLEGMRTTLFRQSLLAEFELAIHEQAEKGEPLTGDSMNALYLKLLRKYYGHDQGVCKVDDLYGVEWAYIPHFYYNFYVYQYATSLVASTTIARNILAEQAANPASHKARDAYLAMLSAGASRYPVDLLKGTGVDMTTSRPFQAAMSEMNQVMDQMEALLK